MTIASVVRMYWLSQRHVMLEGCSIVNDVDVEVPVVGMLPVPVHPVHTCCVRKLSGKDELTEAEIVVPASYQSLLGVGVPYGESTVSMYWCFQEAAAVMGSFIVSVAVVSLPV